MAANGGEEVAKIMLAWAYPSVIGYGGPWRGRRQHLDQAPAIAKWSA